jgi:hypothetical protein
MGLRCVQQCESRQRQSKFQHHMFLSIAVAISIVEGRMQLQI